MQENNNLIERIYKFAQEVKKRNTTVANSVDRTIPALLEYQGILQGATKEQILEIKGVGPKAAYYIERLASGESVEKLLEEVPRVPKDRRGYGSRAQKQDSGEFSGSWDNAVSRVEGD